MYKLLLSGYRNKILFLLIISSLTLFHRLSQSTLGYDDVFYAQCAKEMVGNSDWFFIRPTYAGKILFYNRLPMIYWFLRVSRKIFGFLAILFTFFHNIKIV